MNRRPRRRWLTAAALGAVLLFPGGAGAHAVLTGSSPADGTRLEHSPRTVVMRFNEDVSQRFRSVDLLDDHGRPVPGVRLRPETSPSSQLVIKLPRLGRGSYALAWHVLSEDDGHATNGSVLFGVRTAVLPAAHRSAADVAPAPIDVLLRWLRFSLIAILIGGAGFVALVLRPARSQLDVETAGRARRRVLGAAMWCGALAVVVEVGVLAREAWVVRAASATPSWGASLRDLLFSSRWGTLWLAEVLFLGVFVALLRGIRRDREFMALAATGACVTCALEIAAMEALGSHAASLTNRGAPLFFTGVHLLAASIWIGAVASLVVAVWPANGSSRDAAARIATATRKPFALLAGCSGLAVVTTGLYAAGVHVSSVDALLLTLYGRTVLVKAALGVFVGTLGLVNFLLLRRLARDGRRRLVLSTILAEAVVGGAAFVAAGVLTSAAPARGPAFAGPRTALPLTLSQQVDDVVVTLTVRPNRPGTNAISIVAASTRRPAPGPIDSVHVQLGSSRRVAASLRRVAGGGWLTLAALGRQRAEHLTVVVARGGAVLKAPFRWRVSPADPARPVVYSSHRLAPLTDRAAIALLFVVAVGVALAIAGTRLLGDRSHAHRTSRLEGVP